MRQREHARIQQVAIVQGLVVLVVLSVQPQRTRLDAHVDVFGNQHHFAGCMLFGQGRHNAQNLVVGLASWEAGGQAVVQRCGLEVQASTGGTLPCGIQLEPASDVRPLDSCERIQCPAGLAAIARHFGHALLVGIQLFQHDHR